MDPFTQWTGESGYFCHHVENDHTYFSPNDEFTNIKERFHLTIISTGLSKIVQKSWGRPLLRITMVTTQWKRDGTIGAILKVFLNRLQNFEFWSNLTNLVKCMVSRPGLIIYYSSYERWGQHRIEDHVPFHVSLI